MSFFDSIIGGINAKINVDSKVNANQNKYVVHSGDTLYKIAQENNTTVDELVKLNNISTPDVINIGQEFLLPDDQVVNTDAEEFYTIKSGDTLSKIAQENNTTVDELVRLNNIENRDYIISGQKIKIHQTEGNKAGNGTSTVNNSGMNSINNSTSSSIGMSTSNGNASIGNQSSQLSFGNISKGVGNLINGLGDTLGEFGDNFKQLWESLGNSVEEIHEYDSDTGSVEEIDLTLDNDVDSYDLSDLSWVKENSDYTINLLANRTGQSPEYIASLFNYALNNGYLLSFTSVDMGNGVKENAFMITDPYVLNSKGECQQYAYLEEKTDASGNKYYNAFPDDSSFQKWIDEIKNTQNSTLETSDNRLNTESSPVKSTEDNKKVDYKVLLKNMKNFANNVEDYINENSDKSLFYLKNIMGVLVNIVQESKLVFTNMLPKQKDNLEHSSIQIFDYFEEKVLPLVDNITDDVKNDLFNIKESFSQLSSYLPQDSKSSSITSSENNVSLEEYEIPEVDVSTFTSDSDMDEKEAYDYYVNMLKELLLQLGGDVKEDATNYEIIVSFGDFISNNSSKLTDTEFQDYIGLYNAILEEQILLLQNDKDVFDDFVKYLNVSDEKAEELYGEFEKGNGISALAYSEIANIDSQIEQLEEKNSEIMEEMKQYSMTYTTYLPEYISLQNEQDKNNTVIAGLKQQRYELQQQYNKSLYNYVINLRDTDDYKKAIELNGTVKVDRLDLSDLYKPKLEPADFPIEELKDAILYRDGYVFMGDDTEFSNYEFSDDKIMEIVETLYRDDEFVEKVLDGKQKSRKNFVDSCFANVTDLQTNKTLRIYSYMTDEQMNDWLYLLRVEDSDRAMKYVDSLQDDVNKYCGQIRATEELEKIMSNDSTFMEVLSSFGVSTVDGIEGWFNNIYIGVTGDETTTVEQYATQYLLQTLELSSMFVELDEASIQELLGDNPVDPEITEYLEGQEHITGLDVMFKSGKISEADYNFYLELKDKEPYKEYIEKLADMDDLGKNCIKYSYNVGLNVGNMLPSILTSAVFSGAGLASLGQNVASLAMFSGAYGSAYQTGMKSGKDKSDAITYALISASSEVLTERFLGHTPGISNAKKFVEDSAKIIYTSNSAAILGTLKTVAADLFCEITEEELQNIIERIDDGITGGTFDFSGLKEESIDTAIVTIFSTLLLNSTTNTVSLVENINNVNSLQNGNFTIKLENGTIVPMTIDSLVKDGIINTDTRKINIEKLHDYFATYKNNNVISIDKVTRVELRNIIEAKLKERGINESFSDLTLRGYLDNVSVYGKEIADLIEQEHQISMNSINNSNYAENIYESSQNISQTEQEAVISEQQSQLNTQESVVSENAVSTVTQTELISDLIDTVEAKLKERGINESFSDLTEQNYIDNKSLYGKEIADLVEQINQIQQEDYDALNTKQTIELEQVKTDANNAVESVSGSQVEEHVVNTSTQGINQTAQENIAVQKQEQLDAQKQTHLEQVKAESLTDLAEQLQNTESTSQNDGYVKAHEMMQNDIAELKNEQLQARKVAELEQVKAESLTDLVEQINQIQQEDYDALNTKQSSECLSFSKEYAKSIKQLSDYYGDAGKNINSMFLQGKTAKQILDELDGKAKIDFQNFLQNTRQGQYLASLSDAEIRSMTTYTGSSYSTINSMLRKKNISGTIMGMDAQNLIDNMDAAIVKYGGLERATEIYRAVGVSAFTSQDQDYAGLFKGIPADDLPHIYGVLKQLVGEDFGDLGYMSTSPGYSTSFAKMSNYPIVLDIIADEGTAGAYINQISNFYNSENEFLLARDTVLQMVEVLAPEKDINGLEKIIVKCVVK